MRQYLHSSSVREENEEFLFKSLFEIVHRNIGMNHLNSIHQDLINDIRISIYHFPLEFDRVLDRILQC